MLFFDSAFLTGAVMIVWMSRQQLWIASLILCERVFFEEEALRRFTTSSLVMRWL
jgi:hypothetical protein